VARADRRREARARSDAGFERKYQSAYVGTEGLFFQRLRTHAKWVFVFLAASFAVGFVAFGVGSSVSGGLDQLFQGNAGGGAPSVDEAQERVREQPRNPEALRELADALQQNGRPDEAIAPLERLVVVRSKDEDTLNELAGLYLARASRLEQEAVAAQTEIATLDPGRDFLPPAESPLGQAVSSQVVSQAAAEEATNRYNQAYSELQAAYGKAKTTYARLAGLDPKDPTIQIQLGRAAQSAGDVATAIAAYKRFVQLAPEDPTTPDVKAQIKALQQVAQSSPSAG
jgi:tetratricopeptide (TPR) repeat protein